MERHPETVWPSTQLMFAGYTPDNRQARVRYFQDAVIEPGTPESQSGPGSPRAALHGG
jgi:hypothetical protein